LSSSTNTAVVATGVTVAAAATVQPVASAVVGASFAPTANGSAAFVLVASGTAVVVPIVTASAVSIEYTFSSDVALFAATQAGIPLFYTNVKPSVMQSQTFLTSGTFTVPTGVTQILVSATAAGGSPLGTAGQQILRQSFQVLPGQVITITIGPNVVLSSNGATLVALLDGTAYSKGTRQGMISQDSGIPGLGFGVDSGTPGPAAVVMLWN
jgi:hypothetical protein